MHESPASVADHLAAAPSYFPAATDRAPTFDDDSEWLPLVDGRVYFAELDAALRELRAGDEVLLAGLGLDGDLDLLGAAPGTAAYDPLLERLLAAGRAGVDVRLLLAGKVTASFIPIPGLADFRANAALCTRVNAELPGHALIDYSGPLLGSNHQKTVVITRAGEVTAFIGGIDLQAGRLDSAPHRTQRLGSARWGWHDIAVRLRGPAAGHAHAVFTQRWHEAATLPPRPYLKPRLHLPRINPPAAPTPTPAPAQQPVREQSGDGTVSVRVLRSISNRKLDSMLPWRRYRWDALPSAGVQEIFATLTHAIDAAQRYVYLEDQYLYEYAGGDPAYELYPYLRNAAARGVRVILVGSGVRDPDDPGLNLREINSSVNDDLRGKILDRLDAAHRANVAVYRVEHVTVHAKLLLIDDAFANIGSANLFSRSMIGTDCEISAAVQTTTSLVRDLRVRVWGEHLRAPLTTALSADLGDLDLALGIWDADWLPAGADPSTWRITGSPASFRPDESVLTRVP